MRLNEAKVILEENGYELLEEGKLGRALGIGALALGCLFGVSNATNFDNLRDADTTEIQNEYNYVKKDWDDVKIVAGGIRARTVMKDGTVYNLFKPTKKIENLNDDITAIMIGGTLSGEYELISIVSESGHVTTVTHNKSVVSDENQNILLDTDTNLKFFNEMIEHYRKFIKPF